MKVALVTAAALAAFACSLPSAAAAPDGSVHIELPARIPITCVEEAARRYQLPSIAILSILKVESGGRTGVIGKNKDAHKTRDYGPAQLNSRSWGRYMVERYGISLDALTNNMCQAIMAEAYALRSELNRCVRAGYRGSDNIWCAIALYHHGGALPGAGKKPRVEALQRIYIKKIWKAQRDMVSKGRFE